MATYTELHALAAGSDLNPLRIKIRIAIAIKANTIAKDGTATAGAKAWAKDALSRPAAFEETVLYYVLADYNTAAVGAISGATDAQVQSAVNAAVDTLLGV